MENDGEKNNDANCESFIRCKSVIKSQSLITLEAIQFIAQNFNTNVNILKNSIMNRAYVLIHSSQA